MACAAGGRGRSLPLCLSLIRISDSKEKRFLKSNGGKKRKQNKNIEQNGGGVESRDLEVERYVRRLKGPGLNSFTRILACNHKHCSESTALCAGVRRSILSGQTQNWCSVSQGLEKYNPVWT